jgi:NodT family efflux transporter outer membrane factor (OMF) lipoprotein
MRRRSALALAILLAVTSCSLAPDYRPPSVGVPEAYKENKPVDGWVIGQPVVAEMPRGDWWTVFNDPILNSLEAEVTDANQNLAAAFASYQAARAAVDAAGAALFPIVQADASSARERESINRPLFNTSNIHTFNDNIVSADATYDVDVFGRLRNALASTQAQTEASGDDLETLTLSLHADLAADYYQLRQQDVLVQIFTDTVSDYKKALDLTQQRFDQGIASGIDVAQAQSQLQLAIAQSNAVALARAKLEHAIAVLVGEASATFALAPAPLTTVAPIIPAGLPSELLQRRPDVAAAERRVAAANADIGVARAAFYPDFQFDISGGFESQHLSNWIQGPSRFWSIGPTGMLSVFDAGERDAVLAEAGEGYNQTVATYRQTVLGAYRDVEDALASIRLLDQETVAQQAAVAAAQKQLQYANDRYTGGINTYLEVVVAQTTLLTAQQSLADVLGQRMVARVQLIQALGGGWGPLPPAPVPNPDPAALQNAGKPGSIFDNMDLGLGALLP